MISSAPKSWGFDGNDMQKDSLETWIKATQNKVLIAGYGSLLSKSSRERHSNIYLPTLAARISGWQRAWVTRSNQEKQTYVGAFRDKQSSITVQLIPTEIDPKLRVREQDYRFVQVNPQDIFNLECFTGHPGLIQTIHTVPIYMCETLEVVEPDREHPVNFSYIATCLAGAEEADPEAGIASFLARTYGWQKELIHLDVNKAKYPRAAKTSKQQRQNYLAKLDNHFESLK